MTTTERQAPTRERLVGAAVDLMRTAGYHGTSVKDIVERARAPFGSMYHHFPGGKEELSAVALRTSGLAYGDLVDAFFGDDAADLVVATEAFFAGAAQTLGESDFTDACPIATVALEVASTNDDLRGVCAEVFDDWVRRASARFVQHGIDAAEAPALARVLIMLLEGAFLLSRTSRSTLPLEDAGRTAAAEVARRLGRS